MYQVCGIWQRDGGPPDGLDGMLAALPGGADGPNLRWTGGDVALACRGPSPRAPDAPRYDGRLRLAVAAAARLDGRGELGRRLGLPAAAPPGEFILRAYRRWGSECPAHLLGDFALAVWDPGRRVLFCARDHIGARPLYYNLTQSRFAFASSIPAVLAAPGVPDGLDHEEVARWLSAGPSPPGERTMRRAVRRIPPGHALEVGAGEARLVRWWRPEFTAPPPLRSDDECAEAFLDLFGRAVRDCLSSAGRVGAHLSGGLDSSSVAALAARELRASGRHPPMAFTWHPAPPSDRPRTSAEATEHGLIEAVARVEGLRVVHCPPNRADVLARLRRDPTLGEAASTLVHQEAVTRRAQALGVDVLLSGWGGDEGVSFNGRGHYDRLFATGRWGELWREVGSRSPRPLRHILLAVAPPAFVRPPLHALGHLIRGEPLPRRRSFLRRRRRRSAPARPAAWWPGVREWQLHLLLAGHVGGRVEGWAECGARYGVEHRHPLLDRRLLEFALGLPPECYRRGVWSRWLMRHALRSVLPEQVLWNRDKRDPVRGRALEQATLTAFEELRGQLRARTRPPRRAQYLDMSRLMAHMGERGLRSGVRRGLVTALSFLDH